MGQVTNLIVAGDFNYRDIIWKHDEWMFKGKGNGSRTSKEFIEMIESNFLYQHVTNPTYGRNFLDLQSWPFKFFIR